MDDAVTFGEWVKRRRMMLELTRERLASQVGCSYEAIKKIEADALKPSAQLASLLAVKLNVPVHEHEAFLRYARSTQTAARSAFTGSPVLLPGSERNGVRSLPTSAAPSHFTVPTPLTELVGRSRELTATLQILRNPGVRLLTLVGPPGAGKTRLSLSIARALETEYADGACFVPLAPISDPALVISAIAAALGVREAAQTDLQTSVQTFLAARQLVLVLDNFEQVLSAAPVVRELLLAAPKLTVLVSSRAPLRLYGENEFPVPPLELPNVYQLPPVEALALYSAVALFTTRAQSVKPDFLLTPGNAQTVANICALLDGLPLAIEMAAAQVKRTSLARLLAQLQERLVALTGGARDLTPRQQTLRGAIAWSYDLLDATAASVFRHLGVFIGGGEFQAIESCLPVASVSSPELVNTCLENLIDHSLLRFELQETGDARYTMLETIHEYAREQLSARGELENARTQHAAYYLTLAQAAERAIGTLSEREHFEQLEREHGNLRASLRRAIETKAVDLALALCKALGGFWAARGYWSEGSDWIQQALELDARHGSPDAAARASVLYHAGTLADRRGDYETAKTYHQASLALRRSTGNAAALAESLLGMGWLHYRRGEPIEARAVGEEGLALVEGQKTPQTRAGLFTLLAQLALARDEYPAARRLLQEALTDSRAANYRQGESDALHHLAVTSHLQGDLVKARELHRENILLRRELGNRSTLRSSLNNLGLTLLALGAEQEAEVVLRESLELAQALDEKYGIAIALRNLGRLDLRQGNLVAAREKCMTALAMGLAINPNAAVVWVAHHTLIEIDLAEGAYANAAHQIGENLAHWRAAGDKESIADNLHLALYAVLGAEDDMTAAERAWQECYDLRVEMGNPLGVSESLFDSSYLAFRQGDRARATEHLTASLATAHSNHSWSEGLRLYASACYAAAQNDNASAKDFLDASYRADPELERHLRGMPLCVQEDFRKWLGGAR